MSFTDAAGRSYSTRVTVATYLAIKSKCGVDLNEIGPLVERLSSDIGLLIDVLWVTIQPQTISLDEFMSAMNGETLEAALQSLLEGIIDFFPPAKRNPLRNLLTKGRNVTRILEQRATQAADAITEEQLLSICERQSSGLPESSV